MFKKLSGVVGFLVLATCSFGQTASPVVCGSFTEKVVAEVSLSRYEDNKFTRIASFSISPENRDFALATPTDTKIYRLQVSFYKPGGRHPKLERSLTLPMSFNPGNDYSLKITPSKLDTAKKTGWTLKKTEGRPSYAFIKGKVLNSTLDLPVELKAVANGTLVSSGSFNANKADGFAIPVIVKKPGFYYLQTPRWQVRVFLNPGEKLDVDIDNKTGLIQNVKGSAINQAFYQWQQLIVPITRYGYKLSIFNIDTIRLDAYLDEYKKLQPLMNAFISNRAATADSKALKNAMELDRELAPLRLLYHLSVQGIKGYRPMPKDFKEVPELFKQFIAPGKLGSTSILALGEAREFMNLYAKLNLAVVPGAEKEKLSQGEKLALMMKAISNDTLKSLFLNDQMGQMVINNLSEFKADLEPFKKYAGSGPAKNTYESIYNLFSGDTAFIGKSSYNFSLPDTSGKMVSMKDFKGKVVFIDVWATWCGPCKAQFPFLREIEEEYAGNDNIVFVGISLDKAGVRQKWMDMIKKENLRGIQLLDDFGKTFGRKYDIPSIPRFMLIDKQGRWIEVRCPLPEAKEALKKYLNKALAG